MKKDRPIAALSIKAEKLTKRDRANIAVWLRRIAFAFARNANEIPLYRLYR